MARKPTASKKQERTIRPTKDERLFSNILKVTQQYITGRSYRPLDEEELREQLDISPQHYPLFHKILNQLLSDGIVEMTNKRYVAKKDQGGVAIGILRVHARGFGFLQPDDKQRYPQDVFVPKHLTQNAVDGDRVEVLVNSEAVSEKGPEGRVLTILQRSRTHLGGIIRSIDKQENAIAYVPLLGEEKIVHVTSPPDINLEVGDRVVIEIDDWGTPAKPAHGKVSHSIGHISDASKDIAAAIEEFELPDAFPSKTVKEAEALGNRVPAKEVKSREDLRDVPVVTIDPETAKDFDDAISVHKDSKGFYHLGVHIADVSFYVRRGTALDQEAERRCNSTYFPGVCIPMLPPELSDNLCSLKPNVNRLTASVFMSFDPSGNLTDYRIARTVIRSAKRFSYGEAKEVLDGVKKSPHLGLLKLMVELCLLLKRKRYERGGIEFALPDLVVKVDENGNATGTQVVLYDITHQMIEEFMLKANEVVAKHLTDAGIGLTYRIHDQPAEENLREFGIIAGAFGFKISDQPAPHELQTLFEEALQTPYGPYLAASYIRSMRLAIYSAENIGHYGLGLEYYCHFTSPIRRYVDLVVHRILFGEAEAEQDLDAIAKHCSDQERLSAKAETSVVLLKKLRLLAQTKADAPMREYEAVITRVKPFGIFFEVIDMMLEGFIHISKLSTDYYIFEEQRMRLRGRRSGRIYHSGDRISVALQDVDLVLLNSNWDILEEPIDEAFVRRDEEIRKHARQEGRQERDNRRAQPKGKKRSRK